MTNYGYLNLQRILSENQDDQASSIDNRCPNDKYIRILVITYNIANGILILMPFITCLVLVRFKSSQDILQGVSKLDYYLKVSVFQKYKDQQLEDYKMSFFEEFERDPRLTEKLVRQSKFTGRDSDDDQNEYA